jgi:hypothetical protein
MKKIELINKFIEENKEDKISMNIFMQQKPLFVRPIIVCETCCCCYHVEFELYYDTFIEFGKIYGQVHLLLPHSVLLYLKFYVKEKVMNYFTKKMCWLKEM